MGSGRIVSPNERVRPSGKVIFAMITYGLAGENLDYSVVMRVFCIIFKFINRNKASSLN